MCQRNQYEILKEMQSYGFNITTCGNCGGVILTENDDNSVKCPHCNFDGEPSDYPDLYHEEYKPQPFKPSPKKETRVYWINDDDLSEDMLHDTNKFITFAEGTGNVTTLINFQEMFNRNEIGSYDHIRVLEVNITPLGK